MTDASELREIKSYERSSICLRNNATGNKLRVITLRRADRGCNYPDFVNENANASELRRLSFVKMNSVAKLRKIELACKKVRLTEHFTWEIGIFLFLFRCVC